MTEAEQLLVKLVEELGEVQKACTKALSFGLDDTWPGPESGLPKWDLTPRQEIRHELNDVAGVVALLRNRGILPEKTFEDDLEESAKITKVEGLFLYQKKAGTLDV